MKLFLSWSGNRSKHVASALRDWLPDVLQQVEPWMSEYDVDAGARWNDELSKALSTCDFGIIVISSDNVSATSIHYEAGSLSRAFSDVRVIPYLIDIESAVLKWPLANFQSVNATEIGTRRNGTDLRTKARPAKLSEPIKSTGYRGRFGTRRLKSVPFGTRRLIESINTVLSNPISTERLSRSFEKLWPDLKQKLQATPKLQTSKIDKKSSPEIIFNGLEFILKILDDLAQYGGSIISTAIFENYREGRDGDKITKNLKSKMIKNGKAFEFKRLLLLDDPSTENAWIDNFIKLRAPRKIAILEGDLILKH